MIREEIIRELVTKHRWPPEQIELGERDGYCCRYCGMDLLASVDHFRQWSLDHIVPVSREGDRKDPSNLALACWTCNIFKRQWDPRSRTASEDREELIRVTADYLRAMRHTLDVRLKEQRDLLLRLQHGSA
jgi:5-methylcytosine-specific restriction endonuclease McrA